MTNLAQPPEIDPNDPVLEFVGGILQLVDGREIGDWSELRAEVEAILRLRPAPEVPAGQTAAEFANSLVAEAYERADQSSAALAINALRVNTSCIDAYVLLGQEAGDYPEISVLMFTFGVMVGHDALGQAYFQAHEGEFWQIEETRPFMRALQCLALACWDIEDAPTAMLHFERLLALNREDTQGARYALAALYLEAQEKDAAAEIFAAFPDEEGLLWQYGKALLAFQVAGASPEANNLLTAARLANPTVALYLSGELQPPEEPGPDVDNEAIAAALTLSQAWAATPAATEWLKVPLVAEPPKLAPKERRSGPRSLD